MKITNAITSLLLLTGAASASERRSIEPLPFNVTTYDFDADPAARVLVVDLIGEIALNVFSGVLASGLFSVLFPGSQSAVDLSEESLAAIATLVGDAIRDSWFTRDRAAVNTLIEDAASFNYTGNSETAIRADMLSAQSFSFRANDIANNLESYGIQAVPTYLIIAALRLKFWEEKANLQYRLDSLAGTNNGPGQMNLLKGYAQTRLTWLQRQHDYFYGDLALGFFRVVTTSESHGGGLCWEQLFHSRVEGRPTFKDPWRHRHTYSCARRSCAGIVTSGKDCKESAMNGRGHQLRGELIHAWRANPDNQALFLTAEFDAIVDFISAMARA